MGDIQKPTIKVVDILSEHNATIPKFTITCTSYGGAVRYADWNVHCVPVTATPVLVGHRMSNYSSSVTITGMVDGTVTCLHSNNLQQKSWNRLNLADYKGIKAMLSKLFSLPCLLECIYLSVVFK